MKWLFIVAMFIGTIAVLLNPPSVKKFPNYPENGFHWTYIGNHSILEDCDRLTDIRVDATRLTIEILALNIFLGGMLFWTIYKPRQVKILLFCAGGFLLILLLLHLLYSISQWWTTYEAESPTTQSPAPSLQASTPAVTSLPPAPAIPSPSPTHPAVTPQPEEAVFQPRYSGYTRLTIYPSKDLDYVINLIDQSTSKLAWSIFVYANGPTVKTQIPSGTFEVRFAAGTIWEGDGDLFGPNGRYSTMVEYLTVDKRERNIDLKQVGIGTIETTPLTLEQFKK